MRIIFFCGSMEEALDGVGDYTRRLAGEFIRQGHKAEVVAVNDPYVSTSSEEIQDVDGTLIPVFRIDSGSFSNYAVSLSERVRSFAPDILSLQFVPYSFEKRGLPFQFLYQLAKFGKNYRWHIMFHELWIGGNSFKENLIASFQRVGVKFLIKKLNPKIVHTHLPFYKKELSKLAVNSNVKALPLFSNIPIVYSPGRSNHITDNRIFRLGFFSQADLNESAITFLIDLIKHVKKKFANFEIILIGGSEKKMKVALEILDNHKLLKGHCRYTGLLSAKEVSYAIQQCNLGITPVYQHGLGKSGSVAAFICHGVPVAAPCVHNNYVNCDLGFFSKNLKDSILKESYIHDLDQVKKATLLAAEDIKLSTIAGIMIRDIELAL